MLPGWLTEQGSGVLLSGIFLIFFTISKMYF